MGKSLSVTDPDGRDPALVSGLILTCGLLVLALAIVVGNVVVVWRLGFDIIGIELLGLADLILFSGLLAAAGKVNHLVESLRRKHRYSISEDDYADAPIALQDMMTGIAASANSLRASRAYRDGMFSGLDVERVLYSAAQHSLQADEINATLRKLKANAGPADADALRRARVALRKIGRQLDRINDQLGDAAKTAKSLSKKLDAAERTRENARRAELAAERTRETRSRLRAQLEGSTARANAKPKIDADAISERVAAVSAGYDEVREVSDAVLGAPSDRPADPAPSLAQTAWKVVRSVVRWVSD